MTVSDADTTRILIVDDSDDNIFLVEKILKLEGYQTLAATDGADAIAIAQEKHPHLILLDVMMPGMDGYEVTQQLRADRSLPFIPILLISAHDRSNVVQGLDAGADEFIRKPVEVDELLARVRSLLRLKRSIDDREQMMRQRDDFVSRLTHDLRTPLIAADRMMTLLQQSDEDDLSADKREMLDLMRDSNRNLMRMVDNLLEVYRHDAGQEVLAFAPFNFRDLVATVEKELQPLATEKELDFEVSCNEKDSDAYDRVTENVVGDRHELRRVLTNLIGNAIKFTDEGGISLHVELSPPPHLHSNGKNAPPWLEVTIADTGAGIPAHEQQELFARFRQGQHKRAGSGLGLHLSHRIVQAHGGQISVRSRVGEGSQFIVAIPTEQSDR
ncbi:MAG: hybrid sensor histidine kinase/response regulator [Cyanobacteria bacterium J06639_1]